MTDLQIESHWTVNELLRREPLSAAVLNSLGVDTCCGGGDTLEAAAAAAGISAKELIDAIVAALGMLAVKR